MLNGVGSEHAGSSSNYELTLQKRQMSITPACAATRSEVRSTVRPYEGAPGEAWKGGRDVELEPFVAILRV